MPTSSIMAVKGHGSIIQYTDDGVRGILGSLSVASAVDFDQMLRGGEG